jgi:hypothetical protein
MRTKQYVWASFLRITRHLHIGTWAQNRVLAAKPLDLFSQPFGYRHREFFESCLSTEFKPKEIRKISACIISSNQEIDLLPLSTSAILSSQGESTDGYFLVAPRAQMKQLSRVIPSEFEVIADEDLIATNLQNYIDRNFPEWRRGWIKQQVLKILAARKLSPHGTLLVDADTILLKPQIWLSEQGVQNLQTSIEYHLPYQEHYERFMGLRNNVAGTSIKRPKISFVTHHQVMQPDILSCLFGEEEGFEKGLESWLKCIDFSKSGSPACEWHTYGTFLAANFPTRIHLTQWRNLGISRNSLLQGAGKKIMNASFSEIKSAYDQVNSVSLHHYINP